MSPESLATIVVVVGRDPSVDLTGAFIGHGILRRAVLILHIVSVEVEIGAWLVRIRLSQAQVVHDADPRRRHLIRLQASEEEEAAHHVQIDQEKNEVETAVGLRFLVFRQA